MVRLLLLLGLLLAGILFVISRDSNTQRKERNKGWMRAGGILGLLIILSRITHIPLARLLQLMPSVIGSLRKAAERQAQYQQQTGGHTGMSVAEARLILGVDARASKDDILQAHRKLIRKHHPDHGGSDYLAAKVNEARDVLLG